MVEKYWYAEHLLTWSKAGLDFFTYFDNEKMGCAVRDALRLRAKLTARDESAREDQP